MRSRFVLAVSGALLLGSCESRSPLAPSSDEATLGPAFSLLSGTFNLVATATAPSAIALRWEDISSREDGFQVDRSTTGPAGEFALHAITGANVTGASDVSVAQSSLYCYRVRAFTRLSRSKTTYSAFSNIACAKTPALPPSGVDAKPRSSSEIDIAWTDNAPTDDTFRVERATTSVGPWEVAATTSSQKSYRDASRTADQQLCYRVIAVTADGDSGPSNVDCTAPPAGPTNLTAVATNETIDLAWADNSAVEDGYEVERSVDGVTFYSYARLPANVTRFSDYRPNTNVTFWYRVRAMKDGGFSDRSNVASATRTCGDAPERVCDNGVDDDCDGFADLADPDCTSTICDSPEVECNNYADDDCDGLVDGADPDCPPPPCDDGCPPGMACYPNGYCYYPVNDEGGGR